MDGWGVARRVLCSDTVLLDYDYGRLMGGELVRHYFMGFPMEGG